MVKEIQTIPKIAKHIIILHKANSGRRKLRAFVILARGPAPYPNRITSSSHSRLLE
jgi:hypothetical protein